MRENRPANAPRPSGLRRFAVAVAFLVVLGGCEVLKNDNKGERVGAMMTLLSGVDRELTSLERRSVTANTFADRLRASRSSIRSFADGVEPDPPRETPQAPGLDEPGGVGSVLRIRRVDPAVSAYEAKCDQLIRMHDEYRSTAIGGFSLQEFDEEMYQLMTSTGSAIARQLTPPSAYYYCLGTERPTSTDSMGGPMMPTDLSAFRRDPSEACRQLYAILESDEPCGVSLSAAIAVFDEGITKADEEVGDIAREIDHKRKVRLEVISTLQAPTSLDLLVPIAMLVVIMFAAGLGLVALFQKRNASWPGHRTAIDLSTILVLVVAIVALGLNDSIDGPVLGTLLGGISAYVLGKKLQGNTPLIVGALPAPPLLPSEPKGEAAPKGEATPKGEAPPASPTGGPALPESAPTSAPASPPVAPSGLAAVTAPPLEPSPDDQEPEELATSDQPESDEEEKRL